ncbi:restriction endonuclease subunit S, partial [Neisseria subflava]|uniref:restriction endonuclease subunit S n=1 Tax=Neisseria subflava TaxID=28449 RepID=UPI0024B25664
FKLRKNVVGKRSNEYDLLSLSLKGVIKRDMENPEGKFPAEFDTYQEVKEGDFIFCLFDVEETPRTVGLSSYRGMITGAYTIFETNNVDKKFIYYFYLNLDSDKRLKPLYKGLRNTISKETFFSFNTFIPPLSEQQKIAQFLDDKTAKIDQAVDLAEKQIALLKEHKQILIQNAVTRGLNPDVPLKDSGVEWIGQVPEHWEVKKMKFLFKDTSIKNKPDATLLSVTQNRGVIPRNWLEERTVMPSGNLETFKFIQKDDFAISLRSFEGGLEICHHDGIISPAYTVLKYDKKFLNNGYYKYLFKCQKFISEMQTSIVGIREGKNISYEELKYSFLPIPQIIEQQKIAQFLDEKTAKIDQAIALKTAHIEKLKEYKSVLINDVVTGKVRVSV